MSYRKSHRGSWNAPNDNQNNKPPRGQPSAEVCFSCKRPGHHSFQCTFTSSNRGAGVPASGSGTTRGEPRTTARGDPANRYKLTSMGPGQHRLANRLSFPPLIPSFGNAPPPARPLPSGPRGPRFRGGGDGPFGGGPSGASGFSGPFPRGTLPKDVRNRGPSGPGPSRPSAYYGSGGPKSRPSDHRGGQPDSSTTAKGGGAARQYYRTPPVSVRPVRVGQAPVAPVPPPAFYPLMDASTNLAHSVYNWIVANMQLYSDFAPYIHQLLASVGAPPPPMIGNGPPPEQQQQQQQKVSGLVARSNGSMAQSVKPAVVARSSGSPKVAQPPVHSFRRDAAPLDPEDYDADLDGPLDDEDEAMVESEEEEKEHQQIPRREVMKRSREEDDPAQEVLIIDLPDEEPKNPTPPPTLPAFRIFGNRESLDLRLKRCRRE